MAIKDHPAVRYEQDRSGSWGNAQVKTRVWEFGAEAAAQIIRLMKVYPSMRINSVKATVNDPAGARDAINVGYVNGETEDGDLDYFMGAQAINAQAHMDSRAETFHQPLIVQQDGYLTVQPVNAIAGGDAGRIVFHVEFEYLGNP